MSFTRLDSSSAPVIQHHLLDLIEQLQITRVCSDIKIELDLIRFRLRESVWLVEGF